MPDDAVPPNDRFALPDLADLEAQFAAESGPAPEPAAAQERPEPVPAPNWGVDTYAVKPVMPPLRRVLLPVVLVIAAVAAGAYLLADASEPDEGDAAQQTLTAYVDHLVANGADQDLPDDLAAALAGANRGTAPNGDVRMSLAGDRGCWSVLVPASLLGGVMEGPMDPPRPVLVDTETCR